MRWLRVALGVLLFVLVGGAALLHWAGSGGLGRADSEIKEPHAVARSAASVATRMERQSELAREVGANPGRQILFGDLHVHTTISFDAFMLNLPVMGGQGAHPPADACDFARHCSALDFWSINDHAANIGPADWRNTIDMIRSCNERAGDPAAPDMVSFLGWEWTQAGATADEHYGHKNVVLAHTDDARIPTRPIAATAGGTATNAPPSVVRGALALQGGRFADMAFRWSELGDIPLCADAPVRDLPDDCREVAETPDRLFDKLDDWNHDAIVIPHGTSWGIYTPPTSNWKKQLRGRMHDPARQTLIEVYSGHGDSEVYRDWSPVTQHPDGTQSCPPARPDYLPMCRQAGRIIRARCLEEGASAEECEARAEQARRHAVEAAAQPHVTVPGTTGADWLDAGQCRDCGQPSFKYRPNGSAQAIAALGNFTDDPKDPRRFRMGFIASSDIHTARGGSGYKELRGLSETSKGRTPGLEEGGVAASFLRGDPEPPSAHSRTYEEAAAILSGLQLFETERTQSFLYTGGLVAVHAEGRTREDIWAAFERKEVYGTSGPRMLLWFDLLDGDRVHPMGSEVELAGAPVLRVRAIGSFEQAPGCPDEAARALGPERLERLCLNECHHPTDRRRPITRIDVVRIRPQIDPDEPLADLIDDPWRSVPCDEDPAGCTATFTDPDYPELGRDTLYYARAYEVETPTVNGNTLDCRLDADGNCVEIRPCPPDGDCLHPYAARAWSSPIYVDLPHP